MAELVQIRKKAQLTLPLSIRRKLGIEEGDFMDIHVKDRVFQQISTSCFCRYKRYT